MTMIELPDEQAAALKAKAAARGLSLEGWFKKLAEEETADRPDMFGGSTDGNTTGGSLADLQVTNPQEWARQFRAWADSHDPNIPVLSDEAMSRDSIYPDQA